MIRDLLTAEAQRDSYTWMAVLLAHFAIGSDLWVLFRGWGDCEGVIATAVAYAAFERLQGYIGGRMLYWDSLLDWVGVTLGAVAEMMLWQHNVALFWGAVASIGVLAIVGGLVRR